MDHDPAHPEEIYPGLELGPDGPLDRFPLEKEQLCWVCGWTNSFQHYTSYGSRVKIFYCRDNLALWEVGHRWIIRDQPNNHTLGNDYMTQEFIRNQPGLDIPLVKEMRRLSEPTDKVHLTLMSRAEGVGLNKIWHTLSPGEKSSYKDQLANVIKQLRQFTSPVPRKVDGSPIDDIIISHCHQRPACQKMGSTTDEWFANMAAGLRDGLSKIHDTKDPVVIEEKLQALKDNFPKGEPYVLTHADLHFSNIMVKDGKITAIIDWELAGYFPWWVQRWMSIMHSPIEADELWNPLWEEVDPEIDADMFRREVFRTVAPVIEAWETSRKEHTNERTMWNRPPFCKCKPYRGGFRLRELGFPSEHKIGEVTCPT